MIDAIFLSSSNAAHGPFAVIFFIRTPPNMQRIGTEMCRTTVTPYNRVNFQWQMLKFFSEMVTYR